MKKQENEIPEGYVRVTQLLSPYCDFSHIDPVVLDNAAKRGSRVHELCEAYVKSKPLHAHDFVIDSAEPECKPYLMSFVNWFEKTVNAVLYTEKRINCPKMKLSGQIDLVCMLLGDSDPTILDIKTPQQSEKSWQLQTAGYQILAHENLETPKECRRLTLILDKNGGGARVKEYTDHEYDRDMFLSCYKLFRFFNG